MRLSLILGLVLVPSWISLAAATAATLHFARRRRPPSSAEPLPAVSVLKPLHGAEPGLDENLRSFARQDYPEFELVFGVSDEADAAAPVARALIAGEPGREMTLVSGAPSRGRNGKVANLANMLPAAKHDILVIADADIRVDARYLAAVVVPLRDHRNGLVTCLYRGVATRGLWSELGAMHVNYGFLPAAVLADAIGAGNGCFGATMALRRTVLEAAGGLGALRDELADDYRLGEAVRGLGLAVVLSPYLVDTRVNEPRFRSLWQHELRWARTMRLMQPAGFAGSILMHPVALSLIALLASRFALTSCAFLAISCGLRWASARLLAGALAIERPNLRLLPLRDLLSFAVFVAAFLGRRVVWRGEAMRVGAGGRLTADGETLR